MAIMIDPSEADARAKDNDAKRLLFVEANELLKEQGVFMLAVRALRIRWYREWLAANDRDKERDLRARLQFLDAAPEEIRRFVSDYSMAMDRAKNARSR
jgi:5-carboxymethyl-2-hydroxymuconate isomerase